jgi:uncharacterized membrane protein YjjB (DUF3815 family)
MNDLLIGFKVVMLMGILTYLFIYVCVKTLGNPNERACIFLSAMVVAFLVLQWPNLLLGNLFAVQG